ncbi:hypothetical protein GCM10010271_39650 [Streptomyces kurssanovii]|nr:hypothetical protein GCM10010271_39650 [Streptomyces kurssanovii]
MRLVEPVDLGERPAQEGARDVRRRVRAVRPDHGQLIVEHMEGSRGSGEQHLEKGCRKVVLRGRGVVRGVGVRHGFTTFGRCSRQRGLLVRVRSTPS